MLNRARWLMVAIAAVLAIQSKGEGGIRLPDQPPQETDGRSLNFNEDHGRSVSFQNLIHGKFVTIYCNLKKCSQLLKIWLKLEMC